METAAPEVSAAFPGGSEASAAMMAAKAERKIANFIKELSEFEQEKRFSRKKAQKTQKERGSWQTLETEFSMKYVSLNTSPIDAPYLIF